MSEPSPRRRRYLVRTLLLLLLPAIPALLVYCYFTEASGRRPPTFGRIIVDTPEVYTRERLVNDRFNQVTWLRGRLKLTKPPVGLDAEIRTRERLAVAGGDRAPTPPDDSNGVPVQDAARNAPDPPPESGESGVGSSGINNFRDMLAYRDQIRTEILAAQLDDRHDITGNTLYRLSFDVSLLPGDNTTAWAGVFATLSFDQEDFGTHCPDLYDDWLREYEDALNDSLQNRVKAFQSRTMRIEDVWELTKRARHLLSQRPIRMKRVSITLEVNGRLRALRERREKEYRDRYQATIEDAREELELLEKYARAVSGSPGRRGGREAKAAASQEQRRRAQGQLESRRRDLLSTLSTYGECRDEEGSLLLLEACLSGNGRLRSRIPERCDDPAARESAPSQNAKPVECPRRVELRDRADETLRLLWERRRTHSPMAGTLRDLKLSAVGFDEFVQWTIADAMVEDLNRRRVKGRSAATASGGALTWKHIARPGTAGCSFGICRIALGPRRGSKEACPPPFSRALVDQPRAYTYSATPRDEAQRLLADTEASVLAQGAWSLLDRGSGDGIGQLLSYLRERVVARKTQERHPVVVAISGRPSSPAANPAEASFGWILGAPLEASTSIGPGLGRRSRHIPVQRAVAAIVSVPTWWRSATLRVQTCWIEPDALQADPASFSESACETLQYPIRLPATVGEISRFLGFDVLRRPAINRLAGNKFQLTAGAPGALLIPGSHLWRSTVVTVGSQTADEIEVLPNMRAIIAKFHNVEIPAEAPPEWGSRHIVRVEGRIWTSEGTDSIGPVAIHPPRSQRVAASMPRAPGG